MDLDLERISGELERSFEPLLAYVANPWFFLQLGLIVLLYFASGLLAARIEPLLEARARSIKGQPGILRIVVALLRRTKWLLFTLLLLAAYAMLRAASPARDLYILYAALALSAVWLVVSVASRVVRNRLVARMLQWLAWAYAALLILDIADETATVLDNLDLQLGALRLSALLIIKGVLIVTFSVWLAITIGNFIDARVQRSKELTPSLRVLIGKLTRIALVIIAGALALSAVGVDLTALTVFSGAVGVGIGFGLQKVVSNFVSGIIILLDKSIKPGDTITVGETFGWIGDLRARFVSVVTRDGRKYLIPNEDFISQQVVNWSYSDEHVRLDVKFGVAYGSDPHQVCDLAIRAAINVPRVDADRRPVCWLTGFGESSLDFILRFWIRDPQQGLTNVRGKVLLALWDAFKSAGVEFPYAQRDVLIKSGSEIALRRAPPPDQ